MSVLGCFTCLNCGKNNPVRGHSYTNKYCNNSCQQQHRSRQLVENWKGKKDTKAWNTVPDWARRYLIEQRGHQCEECGITEWQGEKAPLVVDYRDHNHFNNDESNLQLICPNCRSQK